MRLVRFLLWLCPLGISSRSLAGAVVGLVLAPIGARALQAALFGVSPYDPWALAGAVTLLAMAAASAVHLPARRVIRTDPVTILKSE